ncbi:MAG: GNAT family protein [Rhizonema sp. PD38]|nr:GNAT family protein [Rhizonema sp. PD38]
MKRYQAEFEESTGVTFAIVIRDQAVLCGVILLKITATHANAELGYWIGTPYWGQGYCTEAAISIMEYGFLELELNRIYATHFKRNLASGRVLQKIGMKYEGCHRQHIKKWGEFEDLELYGILKSEWLNRQY